MRTTSGRRWRALFAALTCTAVVLLGTGIVPASAEDLAAEPGWPLDHEVAADPAPGDATYIAPFKTVLPPPPGLTDSQLAAVEPTAAAELIAERTPLEADLLVQVHELLAAAGVATTKDGVFMLTDAATAAQVLSTAAISPFGYARFGLVRNTSSTYARNGYLGTLRFVYGIYSPTIDAYRWYTVSWPARSGNNIPSYQSRVGVGPIPAYTWDLGFANGVWRGYEGDGRESFYAGKWRLDPWSNAPYGRGSLEIHGGSGTHTFAATSGCIRLYPAALASLKSYYDSRMANKKNRASAHLYVTY